MQIIDKYLLKQFLKSFTICFLSLAGLFVVIDLFANLDEFLAAGEKQGGTAAMIGQYYSYRTLMFFDRTVGILTLLSAMFTMAWLQRHSEMTALMAAGVSKGRIIRTIVVAAGVISLGAAASRELVIPSIRHHLAINAKDLKSGVAKDIRPRFDHATDVLLGGKKAYPREHRIEEPTFHLKPPLDRYGGRLVADEAIYESPSEDRPGGYRLRRLQRPKALARGASAFESLSVADQPILLMPSDTPWLNEDEVFLVSDVTLEQLIGGEHWKQYSSTAELIDGLSVPGLDFGADVRVAIHSRVLNPVLDMTLLFLGLPLVLRKRDRGVILAVGMAGLVVAGYYVVVLACQQMGNASLIDPALASWLPLMIFVPIAVWMSESIRK
ncbi:MAG: LptF/LptG family permease [Pirellulales bacterium]|nr:LptF/LptG family permease [Pirellulales bacterium]